MAILKYKLNGEWIELGGGAGAGGSVEVDSSLSQEGKAADAKATGDAIISLGETMGEMFEGTVNQEQLEETMASMNEVYGAAIAEKQSKAIFSETQPTNWQNGDIWLKPAE